MSSFSEKPLLLAEQLIYLIIDNNTNQIYTKAKSSALKFALYGTILMELEIRNRISINSNAIIVNDTEQLGIPLIDNYFQDLIQADDVHSPSYWIRWYVQHKPEIFTRVSIHMSNRNLLDMVKKTGPVPFFQKKEYHIQNLQKKTELVNHLRNIFDEDVVPTLNDKYIIGLLGCCQILHHYLTLQQINAQSQLFEDIVNQIPIINAVFQSIRNQV